MNDERGKRVVRSQRVPARNILKIKRKPIGHPRTRLDRAAIALLGEQCSVWASDVNLDNFSIRRVPTQRGLPCDGVACDGNRIWTGRQRWSDRRTRCIDRGPAYIPLKSVRPRIRQILDIQTTARRVIE